MGGEFEENASLITFHRANKEHISKAYICRYQGGRVFKVVGTSNTKYPE